MLGLGDIVIPGIFIALCLKFDIDRCIEKKLKKVE
jgi:minor histocompatibility antigen H13